MIGAVDTDTVAIHTAMLGPLSLGALHHIVQEHLGHTLSRPTLIRLVDAAGGNPLFVLELARALERTGSRATPGAPLPVPDTLRELTTDRLAMLSAHGRHALVVAALAPHPTVALLRRLGASGGLREAEAADIVAVQHGAVVFAHPLLAWAAVASTTAAEQRAAHAALAADTADAEHRAHHLALAAEGPDEEVAAALESAAAANRARGATVSAAELARLARDHTPDQASSMAMRRASRLGDLLFETGDASAAEDCYRSVVAGSADPHVRRAQRAGAVRRGDPRSLVSFVYGGFLGALRADQADRRALLALEDIAWSALAAPRLRCRSATACLPAPLPAVGLATKAGNPAFGK